MARAFPRGRPVTLQSRPGTRRLAAMLFTGSWYSSRLPAWKAPRRPPWACSSPGTGAARWRWIRSTRNCRASTAGGSSRSSFVPSGENRSPPLFHTQGCQSRRSGPTSKPQRPLPPALTLRQASRKASNVQAGSFHVAGGRRTAALSASPRW